MQFLFSGILLVSQLVLVLMLMLDAYATGFLHRQKIAIVYSSSSGTQCVVTLFKAKVISRVNVEYQLPDYRIQYVILLKGGIHTMYYVKWKMTILFLTYREKYLIFDI